MERLTVPVNIGNIISAGRKREKISSLMIRKRYSILSKLDQSEHIKNGVGVSMKYRTAKVGVFYVIIWNFLDNNSCAYIKVGQNFIGLRRWCENRDQMRKVSADGQITITENLS